MKGQYVIIDLRNMDFMKNEDGNINYYNSEDEACTVCGMYEFATQKSKVSFNDK